MKDFYYDSNGKKVYYENQAQSVISNEVSMSLINESNSESPINEEGSEQSSPKNKILLSLMGVLFLLSIILLLNYLYERVGVNEIQIVQSPFSGKLTIHSSPGLQWNWFGEVTSYKKENQYVFSGEENKEEAVNPGIRIQFNDGGKAILSGSVRWGFSSNAEEIMKIHTIYENQKAFEEKIIRRALEQSALITGTFMSSQESYTNKRNDFVNYILDQTSNGIYKLRRFEVKEIDSVSGKEGTKSYLTLIHNPVTGNIEREEKSLSLFQDYGISIYDVSINDVKYDAITQDAMSQRIFLEQKAIQDAEIEKIKAEGYKKSLEMIK